MMQMSMTVLFMLLWVGFQPEDGRFTYSSCKPNASHIAPRISLPQPLPPSPEYSNIQQEQTASAEWHNENTPPDTITYLALGDSYTIGESVPENERWPVQLAAKINAESNEVVISDPFIIATTGWTTTDLSQGMDQLMIDTAHFDLVSILIGVNNQYQGLSLTQYEVEFGVLLNRAIALAGGNSGRVFVVSIPDYGYTPFGESNQATISTELAEFNAACERIATAHGVAHYNITPISQQWPHVPNLIAPDNLHPSSTQYRHWVVSFWQDVLGLLTNH